MKKLLLSNFCLEFPIKYYTFLLVSNQDNIFYMCQVMTKLSHKQEVWNLFDFNENITKETLNLHQGRAIQQDI